jgi:hypothetical protein
LKMLGFRREVRFPPRVGPPARYGFRFQFRRLFSLAPRLQPGDLRVVFGTETVLNGFLFVDQPNPPG